MSAAIAALPAAVAPVAEPLARVKETRAPLSLLSPLLAVLPGQLFAVALAQAKGLDPGAPRDLPKVTFAR